MVEILLAITIFAIFSVGIFYLSIDVIQRDSKIELDTLALNYAQEGLEAVRNIRDRNFLILTNGDHGLNFSNDSWSFIEAPEDIDGFYSRRIVIEDVYRDSFGNIASDGTFDPDTKKITAEVYWNLRGVFPRTASLYTYLSNWRGEDLIQTTCLEFNPGTFSNTESRASNSPPADNCNIQLQNIENPSTFFSSVDIGDHANDVEVSGNYAYVSNDKREHGFTIINVSDPENPAIVSQLDIGSKSKFLHQAGIYAYLGTELNGNGLSIVDVTDPLNPNLLSQLDVLDYGNNLAVSGNYLYMGVEEEDKGLAIVDISDKLHPQLITSMDFGDKAHAVEISGNIAYVGVEDDYLGLRVIDISNPANPAEVSSLSLDEEVNAIALHGIFAFLGIEQSSNSLQVVNISDPANPTLIKSLNVNGEIEDLVVYGDYLYAAIDNQDAGLAAINISDPTNPQLAYNTDLTGKGKGIDTDGQYVYIAIDTNNRGVVIVGATESGIIQNGTYTSPIFDSTSSDTRYNFIEWEHTQAPGSSVKFQIRTADTSLNLANANWVGSDGTINTYYESSRTSIILDPLRTGQRYFQYRIFIDSDGVTTPVIESVKINYNP